ncbi:MAG TPA: hypothetical protein DDW76_04700 [Cyanobacteria bacterium UBA11369]|nr:hypothetical protein [Cyanobacteria bacterium UBA11371]HBE35580.1 hypothetical protein [Cyanobacteria bacterium UBA11368]HBE48106.1 hypothetical protein [Cyanobacteria bacterium UBA11369]
MEGRGYAKTFGTAQYAIQYLESLDTRKVAPTADAIANLIQFDQPLPNEPVEPRFSLGKTSVCRETEAFIQE